MADLKDDIEKYRKGELTSSEMHALEKKALRDPFLAGALEGAESISFEDFSKDISEIQQKLSSQRKKKVWFTPLRIAAGLVLLAGSIFLIYQFNQPEEQLTLQKEEAPSPKPSTILDSTSKKDQSGLLSLNQPKEETDNVLKRKSESIKTNSTGSAEAKPTTETTADQIIQPDNNNQAKANKTLEPEQSEIAAEISERERTAVLGPVQQSFKKEVVTEEVVSQVAARKNKLIESKYFNIADPSKMVTGQVTSAEDGLALPGVNVVVKGTTIGTVTDMQGNYSIPLESENQKLVFSFIGLQTSEVSPNDKSIVNVKLLEDISQLSEVVVTGQGFNKSLRDENETPVIKLAEPFGGRKAYDRYLEKNLRYPQLALENKVKGKVTIEFTVSSDGALRDFNVLKSLGFGCDDEVIRLVKEGPKWSPSTEDDIAIESNVRVRMKFDPEKGKK